MGQNEINEQFGVSDLTHRLTIWRLPVGTAEKIAQLDAMQEETETLTGIQIDSNLSPNMRRCKMLDAIEAYLEASSS